MYVVKALMQDDNSWFRYRMWEKTVIRRVFETNEKAQRCKNVMEVLSFLNERRINTWIERVV